MRGVFTGILFGVTVLLTITFSSGNADSAIFDGTFNDSDWTHAVLQDDTGTGTHLANQVPILGNPGSWQTGSHEWGPGNSFFSHIFSGAGSYDPSLNGAIDFINYSFDFLVTYRKYRGSDDMAAALILKQGSDYFANLNYDLFDYGDPWRSIYRTVSNMDFWKVTASGYETNIQPDFSAAGQPIEVGYYTLMSTGYKPNHLSYGIDNFRAEFIPTPIPGSVWCFVSGLLGLSIINRRLRI